MISLIIIVICLIVFSTLTICSACMLSSRISREEEYAEMVKELTKE